MHNIEDILAFVDDLIYRRHQRHLNDLQRLVLRESWQHEKKTYDQIAQEYNYSAGYIKQGLAPQLWKLLSDAFGEKVTKTNMRSVLERHISNQSVEGAKIFLAYSLQRSDVTLVDDLRQGLTDGGHLVSEVIREDVCQGDNWMQQVESEYNTCDYALILLSSPSLVSELVTEGFKRAIAIKQSRSDHKPIILTIFIKVPPQAPIHKDLHYYLQQIPHWDWHSDQDTPDIISSILTTINQAYNQITLAATQPALFLPDSNGNSVSFAPFAPLDQPPSPMVDVKLPDGRIPLDSPFYIERSPHENSCYQEIIKPGALVRITAPRQMGKTSLMLRALNYAIKQNYQAVVLHFQQIEQAILDDINKLLRWFCANLARQLQIKPELEQYWDQDLGSKTSCTIYLQEYILAQSEQPIVIALEELNRIYDYPKIAQEFLPLLRSWYEEARTNPVWEKLKFILVQSTESYVKIDLNQSPFNVGLNIRLPRFTKEEVHELAARYHLQLDSEDINRIINLLAGHPYLVRLTLYYLAKAKLSLEQILNSATTDQSIYSDHLHRHLWHLQQYPQLATAYRQVLQGQQPLILKSDDEFKLLSLGLIDKEQDLIKPSCELYYRYFSQKIDDYF